MTKYFPQPISAILMFALGIAAIDGQPAAAAPTKAVVDGSPNANVPSHYRLQADNSAGNTSSQQLAGDEDPCTAVDEACSADTDCSDCVSNAEFCSYDVDTCSDLIDEYCCIYGESCSSNALLVAHTDCIVSADGCTVDNDLCDLTDDNGDETCGEYTGGCPSSDTGPALDDVVCYGACDEDTCCVWNDSCYDFPETDCPSGTTYDETQHCNGTCDATDAACCAASTCGNSFDYDDLVNGCTSSEGRVAGSTLCSTGANGCDYNLCCVPNESCSAFDANDCENPLWRNEDEYCDGVCDSDDVDQCCTNLACATHFNSRDCTNEANYDDTAVCPCEQDDIFGDLFCACDQATCCTGEEDSSEEESSEEDSSEEDSSVEDSWDHATSPFARSSLVIAFGSAAASILVGILY